MEGGNERKRGMLLLYDVSVSVSCSVVGSRDFKVSQVLCLSVYFHATPPAGCGRKVTQILACRNIDTPITSNSALACLC